MTMNSPDKTFPSLRLADAHDAETPSQACRRRLKEMAERLDEPHVFSKGQFVRWIGSVALS